MLLIHAEDIKKHYGDRLIVEARELKIYSGDRIGIVGMNGAGKTTLMDLLAGALEPDSGKVKRYSECSYIRQFGAGDKEASLKSLKEFGLKGINQETMSGGELTRLRITKELSEEKPLLLADEPTSNLDIRGIELLQKKFLEYRGAVVLISHDRELLDNVCKKIVEIEDGNIKVYPGNYSGYKRQKEMERERELFEYNQYIEEKKRLEDTLKEREVHASSVKKAPKRMGNSEARLHKRSSTEIQKNLRKTANAIETRLEKLEVKSRPKEAMSMKMELDVGAKPVSRIAARGKGINVKFGAKVLFEDASFEIASGSKTALIGGNGTGKTTLAKMIVSGQETIRIANGVRLGYFNQQLKGLDEDGSILENVMSSSGQREYVVRTVLARMLFKREAVLKKVSVLSGGEKVKVALAKLIVSDSNFLLLDEPTNYLDMMSMDALQGLLREYEGTVLMVSHDRRFIDSVADRLLIIEQGKLKEFEGNYGQYAKRLEEVERPKNDRGVEEMVLKMKLAEILSRLSMPSKNDDVEELDRQFKEINSRLKN